MYALENPSLEEDIQFIEHSFKFLGEFFKSGNLKKI